MFSCASARSAPFFWRYDHASNSNNLSWLVWRAQTLPVVIQLLSPGRKLLEEAIAKEYLKAPYVDIDKRHRGSALNYDLYDADRNEVLVQRRYTVCTKYGNSPTKDYFVIRRHRQAIQVLLVSDDAKRLVVKRSRTTKELGEVLEVLHRNDEVFSPPSKCFMVVEILEQDRLQSLEFKLPLWRTKDSVTFRDGKTWFQLFCTRDRLDRAIRDEKRYQGCKPRWKTSGNHRGDTQGSSLSPD